MAVNLCHCTKKISVVENTVEEEYQKISILPQKEELKAFDITPFLDTVKYVKLQLTDESIIGTFDKVIIYEDRIYILDTQTSSLFIYDMDGTYLSKIARVGHGPGEYIQLDFFDIDYENKHILLTDLMAYWIMRYDLDGNFISRHKIPFWVEGISSGFEKGYILYSNFRNNQENMEPEYNLLYVDSLMHIKQAYFPYRSSGFKEAAINFPTPEGGSFYSTENETYFFFPYGNIVYQVTPEKLIGKYLFDFGKYTFDSSYLKNSTALKVYLSDKDFNSLSTFKANDELFFCTMNTNIVPLFAYNVYYSKKTGNTIGSFSFVLGSSDHYFHGWFKTGYKSWIVSELLIDELLDWRDSFQKKNLSLQTKLVKEKKAFVDGLTMDDNSVLMFYKLKNF